MSFEKAENFLLLATKKYKLERQAKSGLICERARKIIQKSYQDLCDLWTIKKCENGVLFIAAENSTSKTELFLRTQELLEIFSAEKWPEKIHEIRIVRK